MVPGWTLLPSIHSLAFLSIHVIGCPHQIPLVQFFKVPFVAWLGLDDALSQGSLKPMLVGDLEIELVIAIARNQVASCLHLNQGTSINGLQASLGCHLFTLELLKRAHPPPVSLNSVALSFPSVQDCPNHHILTCLHVFYILHRNINPRGKVFFFCPFQ